MTVQAQIMADLPDSRWNEFRKEELELKLGPCPNFLQYQKERNFLVDSAREKHLHLHRLDCMNPFKALEHYLIPFPTENKLNMMETVSREQVAKAWLSATNLEGLMKIPSEPTMTVTSGVRESYFSLLSYVLEQYDPKRVHFQVPEDVYPKYEMLLSLCADDVGNGPNVSRFRTLPAFRLQSEESQAKFKKSRFPFPYIADTISEVDVNGDFNTDVNMEITILPLPLSPSGRWLSEIELNNLVRYFQVDSHAADHKGTASKLLILDNVYAFDFEECKKSLMPLLKTGNVIGLFSMSKSYICPFLDDPNAETQSKSFGVGFTIIPRKFQMMKEVLESKAHVPSTLALKKAAFVLENQPTLPRELNNRFKMQWMKLGTYIRENVDSFWKIPAVSYFSHVDGNWIQHLAEKEGKSGMCVPASVFGSSNKNKSIISCLYDIKKDDHEKASKTFYHVAVLSNFCRAYDKYSCTYNKSLLPKTTFGDKFFLLKKNELSIGIRKASELLEKLNIEGDELVLLETCLTDEELSTLKPAASGKGQSIDGTRIVISNVFRNPGKVYKYHASLQSHVPIMARSIEEESFCVEEAMSLSLRTLRPHLKPYNDLTPRSVSVLPVTIGCQAKCPFCFSHSSVSNDPIARKQGEQRLTRERIVEVLREAKKRGSTRAVITGGGEPTMLSTNDLNELVGICGEHYDKVVLITNGYKWGTGLRHKYVRKRKYSYPGSPPDFESIDKLRLKELKRLKERGLTVLAVSRHGYDDISNTKIMNLDTGSEEIAKTVHDIDGLEMRWICVLQRGGVENLATLERYVTWASTTKVKQICFKELYVSTSTDSKFHDTRNNVWAREMQIPLKLVIQFCEQNGFQLVDRLPWDAPVYEGTWEGVDMQIAAYTEPSLMWEREHGILRSWNLLASGKCLASLEDSESQVCA
eukprot:CAMPEP_0204836224 /NCGR_PEP_ID=MMETSP1346-20131115/24514_1 /ASSEMBLY_ACC=CAM_ASM_000771 /TAXON_ID=215587 /ORGANISM="Aplanochytrium stocchinoi, Strain GSBS06" /LENGTH=922 /DNA_ID=CAMNT_0051970771 /DNA_START=115 /DNA_END=2883 /DNA_ORIENTATION=+